MTPIDPDIERAARFVAGHALLFLALASLAVAAAPVLLLFATRWLTSVESDLARRLVRRIEPSGYLLLHLSVGLVSAAAAAGFIVIASGVTSGGELARFDLALADALAAQAGPQLRRLFGVVTWLGSIPVLAAGTLVVACLLLVNGRRTLALGWVGAQAGGGLLNAALKELFARTRPEYADPLLAASSFSFPSGHAMGTFIFAGLGAYLLIRTLPSPAGRLAAVAAAVIWSTLIGFSRIYLGVHFASDVVAGYLVGAIWVGICISGIELARRRVRMNPNRPGT